MHCPSCGGENAPGSRLCIHCGVALPGEEAAARGQSQGAAQRRERLGVLYEELSSIEFALQELDATPQEEALAPQNWEVVRHRLLARRRELEVELIPLYGSLPTWEAIDRLTGFLNLDPTNVQARLERGLAYQQARDYDSAFADYTLAAALDPAQAEPHLRLAHLYELLVQKTQALYEYRTYIALESDPLRRWDFESIANSLEQELFPDRAQDQGQPLDETTQRLEYLVSALKEPIDQGPQHPALQELIERYTRRLNALSAAAASEPVAPPVVFTPVAHAPPAQPPGPPAAPPVPREPFDWGAFWAALFSERTLTAFLGFGVLLIVISSLVVLVSQWQAAGNWEQIWPLMQAILVGQLFLFLAVGYVIKEKLKLHLTGLAVITIGALWIPINMGALMFRLPPFAQQINVARDAVGGDPLLVVPGIGLPLDLPILAWLIVVGTCVPTWAALNFRFRGHLLTHGTVAAIGATVALFLAVLVPGIGWEWPVASLAVLTIPLLFAWHYLRQNSFKVIAEPLFWTAQATLSGVAVVLLVAYILGGVSAYSLALVALVGAGLYATAHRYSPNLIYEYVVAALPLVAILFVLSGLNVRLELYDALFMVMAAGYIVIGRVREKRYQVELLRSSRWPVLQPAYAVGYLLVLAAVIWPSFQEVSRMGVLYGATAVTLLAARWWGRALWTYLASLLFVAAILLTLDLVGLDVAYWAIPLALLAGAYFLGALALKRLLVAATPVFSVAYGLTLAAMAWTALDSFRK